MTDGEKYMAELILRETIQKIRLIFTRVCTAQQFARSLPSGALPARRSLGGVGAKLGIVPRCNFVRALLASPCQKGGEFYRRIAKHVGIRRDAGLVIGYHAVHHLFLIGIGEVYLAEWNRKCSTYTHCIKPVFLPRAFDEFRPVYPNENPRHVMTLLPQ